MLFGATTSQADAKHTMPSADRRDPIAGATKIGSDQNRGMAWARVARREINAGIKMVSTEDANFDTHVGTLESVAHRNARSSASADLCGNEDGLESRPRSIPWWVRSNRDAHRHARTFGIRQLRRMTSIRGAHRQRDRRDR
jgi:hypothetical protein